MKADLPLNETQRVQALHRFRVLDTAPEPAFDRITRLASGMLDAPIALVSLIDENRQWFKSKVGTKAEQSPRELAFCAHTILGDEVVVVSDTTTDDRFRDHPMVAGVPHVRSYCGAPLITRDQHRIGALCVIDYTPREFPTQEVELLRELAIIVVDELELRLREIENKEQIEELEDLKLRHELALEASAIGVWDWDVKNDHLIWDERMYRLYGVNRGDFSSAYDAWLQGVHPDDKRKSDAEVSASLAGKQAFDTEFRVVWPSGDVRAIRAIASVKRDEAGEPNRMIGVNWDITEDRRAKELLRVNADLEQFAYFASHDLQAPLRHVTSFVQLIRERLGDDADEDITKWMGFVTQGTTKMKRLIDDLLDYSRVGRTEVVRQAVSMAEVVASVKELLDADPLLPKLQVDFDTLPLVRANRVQMEQLVQNLLANSIRYRKPKVEPKVQITFQDMPERWVFHFKDNGQGIDPKYHDRVFRPFQRFSEEGKDGTGIGLAICAKIAEHHGGYIAVSSSVGEGATFTFSLRKP